MYRQPNAERVVILVNITQLATLHQKHVLMDVLLITPAVNVLLVTQLRPAHTLLTKLVVMDVRLTVLAALLAKLANHPAVHQHRQRLRTATAILVRQDINQVLVVQDTYKKQQHPEYVLAEQKAAELAINVKRLLHQVVLTPLNVLVIIW